MTQAVAQLFQQIEQLSADERFELRELLLQQHDEFVDASYVGEDLTEADQDQIAAELFREIDRQDEAYAAKKK